MDHILTPIRKKVLTKMTTVSRKDVAKAARLSRIRMTDAELDAYAPQLDRIVGWIEQLGEVDTDNVEPLANVVDIDLALREDDVTDGDNEEGVLSNAPEKAEGFYVVPKVVE